MRDTSACTHSIVQAGDGRQEWVDCGNPTYVIFSQQVRVMGRKIWRRHPRCTVHASSDVIRAGQEQGYKVDFVEERV